MIYTEEIENKIRDIYDEKQSKVRFLIAARREKIYTEIPEIKEIEDAISREGISLAMASLKGTEYVPEKDMDKLAEEKGKLLEKNGYPKDYMENVFECSNCKDTGYINGKMCDCVKKEMQKHMMEYSNIAPTLLNVSLKDFILDYYSDAADEQGSIPRDRMWFIFAKCKEFIEDFGKENVKSLFFFGNTGLGKTFLSAAIARELSEQGYSVLYFSAKQLLSMMTEYDFGRIPEKKQLCESVFTSDLLIIDDLGSEQQTAYSISTLFDIINTRALNGKKMIINTNLAPRDLHTIYSDRIYSRINEFETLKFIGEDIRIIKKYK